MKRSIAATILALVAGCESKAPAADTTKAPPPPPAAAAAPTAAARIVTPVDGETTGADVTIVLSKEGVTIAKADGAKVEGIGHFHLFLDTIPTAAGAPIPPTTKNIVHIGTGDTTYTFKGLKAGEHTVIAVIGYGDHTP